MSNSAWMPRLNDPDQAEDHFRRAVRGGDLTGATALLVCCDTESRPLAHLLVADCDLDASPSENADVLGMLLHAFKRESTPSLAGLALGLTRPGSEQVQHYDRSWFRACYRVCHQRGLVCHGVYVVTRGRARAIHIDDAA
ncbi:MAG: hypothetical protein QOI51_2240 [Nocardioidaceae bacterium]|nr:hypothetical protein [Nocardioidaceae bacterium]